MIKPDRVAERMKDLGYSQSSLAREVGVSQATIGKIVTGQSAGSSHLHKIARLLRTTAAYLTGEVDDAAEDAFIPPSAAEIAEQMGLVRVEEIDLSLGMGAGFLDEHALERVDRWIPEEWVSNFTQSPAAHLSIVKPQGDSMYPTINDRDIVMIDRSQRTIDRQEGIWALDFAGFGTIKRVRKMPDGTYKLMADNPAVPTEIANGADLHVIGRVAGVFRRA
ncbi:S24 family peptidase [Novosphingobium resinovorum]|uniref:XRE family transcriptional regulator n=1 Tax=Novosphingobium TaxID=165696 RepID=UPI001B3C4D3C|nr:MULTISPECIES: S24 family peptidase [Novosphingobium]MBF7010582.1 helix-turn-helix transcriptional regulator [Novosphingobium sp. HR1a]WJM28579.1 S24 family peptidase [Novosphingobium resinovorum]